MKCFLGEGSFFSTAPTEMMSLRSNAGEDSLGGGLLGVQERASVGL